MVSARAWLAVASHLVTPLVLFGIVSGKLPAAAPKKVALLVGVNKHQKRNFPDLDYAERDVEALARELQNLGFDTVVLTGSGTGERQATRKNIEERLKGLLRGISRDDIVVVVLNGHGIQLKCT